MCAHYAKGIFSGCMGIVNVSLNAWGRVYNFLK